jgi:hypothetical protein
MTETDNVLVEKMFQMLVYATIVLYEDNLLKRERKKI